MSLDVLYTSLTSECIQSVNKKVPPALTQEAYCPPCSLVVGWGVPTLVGGTYLGWDVPSLARGYLSWPGGYLPWPGDTYLDLVYLPWPEGTLAGGTYLGQGVPTLARGVPTLAGGYLTWLGYLTPRVWTDKQAETITFPHPTDGNNRQLSHNSLRALIWSFKAWTLSMHLHLDSLDL